MRRTFALAISTALGLTAFAGAALSERGPGLFERSDTNGDGFVSKEEFAAGRDTMFTKLDANSDGTIDQAEIDKAREAWHHRMNKPADQAHADGKGRKHGGFMQRIDANSDGKVTADEFAAAGDKMFARLDDNGDGKIAKDELPQRHKRPHDAPAGSEAPAQ
ncbi:EF-hand domain-containing protein [Dongia deserti]|uniref:EF-hand domain-containing protein n=1 Tax=Dongia deserti TaxID=2268030 RepID=UPI000E65603D|nr:EF-hand domain-containing protein [Dongia deserti]